jgi:hypothetical protein
MAVIPGIAFAGNGTMDEMHHVSNGLQGNFGTIESAAACCRAWFQSLGAALFAVLFRFALVVFAAGFIENFLNFVLEHKSLLEKAL